MRGVSFVRTDTLNPDETPADAAEGAHAHRTRSSFVYDIFFGKGGVIAENL